MSSSRLITSFTRWRGEDRVRQAPDVYVVFGRPKGDRGSYRYWREENVPVTVAFEILSPGNTYLEMLDKLEFYNEHGIEEYYVYDPDTNRLLIYHRKQSTLVRHYQVHDFISPRMGIRFDLSGEELVIRHPDGRPFVELVDERRRADQAEQQLQQATERLEQTSERLAQTGARLARIIELSKKARRGQATAEELGELERLEDAG